MNSYSILTYQIQSSNLSNIKIILLLFLNWEFLKEKQLTP